MTLFNEKQVVMNTIKTQSLSSTVNVQLKINSKDEWESWLFKVPSVEFQFDKIDLIIETIDTIRHEILLYTWLHEHKLVSLLFPMSSEIFAVEGWLSSVLFSFRMNSLNVLSICVVKWIFPMKINMQIHNFYPTLKFADGLRM